MGSGGVAAPHGRDRPGPGEMIGAGWRTFTELPGELILIALASLVFSLPSMALDVFAEFSREPINFMFMGLGFAYEVLVVVPVGYGVALAYYHAARGVRPESKDVLAGFKRLPTCIATTILQILLILVGLVLLIVPGIILMARLFLAPLIVIAEGQGPIAALQTSWDRTRVHTGRVVLFGLLVIGVLILGALAFVIGLVPASAIVGAAVAHWYIRLSPEVQFPVPESSPYAGEATWKPSDEASAS